MIFWKSISDVNLTSDFIAGFCGETEAAHEDTVSLMRLVKYNFCYVYPYSMRAVCCQVLLILFRFEFRKLVLIIN
jgi:tRNA A37 methylthiotransferase MiaB